MKDERKPQRENAREKKAGKAEKKKIRKRNREFTVITYLFFAIFAALAVYFCYFLTFRAEDFINSPYNPRLSAMEEATIRGDIRSADGQVLATTTVYEDGTEVRSYPFGRMYAHAVGFNVNGMAGAELSSNFQLLRSHEFILTRLINDLKEEKNRGDAAVLSIDSRVQTAAYNGLSGYRGAVVALEPSTGKILCMVSAPDFDPNTISADWDYITSDETSSVLLNRTTQGLYPPGSTFKIITALEYISEGGQGSDTFDCQGEYTEDGFTIHCYNSTAHGEENFLEAFGNSCNVAFSQVGLSLDIPSWQSRCKTMLFNQKLPTKLSDISVSKSSFALKKGDSASAVMQTAIGQGETLMTPLHMAMISAAIANKGIVKEPYLVDHIESDAGTTVRRYHSTTYGSIITSDEADMMRLYMRYVITNGNGQGALSDRYVSYGKTGTAEYTDANKDDTHSWFAGFAEDETGSKQIAVAAVVESAGSGSTYALPIAKSVFDAYFAE